MPGKSVNKRRNNKRKTRKQKLYIMRGCSKNHKSCKNKHKIHHKCSRTGRRTHHHLKGGVGCGAGSCPLAPLSQNGGCDTCGLIPPQAGGSFFKPASPMPCPFVGSAWGTSVNNWPGVNGIVGDKNYLKGYDLKNDIVGKDPQLQMSMNDAGYKTLYSKVGGYKYKPKSIRGGGLIPQDLVNLGSDFTFNLKSAYNALNGYNAPVEPMPYKGQLTNLYNNGRVII